MLRDGAVAILTRGQKKYIANLTSAHAVMVAAMKCKQNADPALADSLQSAIEAFHLAYTGKAADGAK